MDHLLSPQAVDDLDHIWLFVARESGNIEIATRLIDSIAEQFLFLARFPFLGRARDDDFGSGLRSFPVSEYLIVYCVAGEDVLILRVVHGRRDLWELFEK